MVLGTKTNLADGTTVTWSERLAQKNCVNRSKLKSCWVQFLRNVKLLREDSNVAESLKQNFAEWNLESETVLHISYIAISVRSISELLSVASIRNVYSQNTLDKISQNTSFIEFVCSVHNLDPDVDGLDCSVDLWI